MNKIVYPAEFDDVAALNDLSCNAKVKSFPYLKKQVKKLTNAYDHYSDKKGNAKDIIVTKISKKAKNYLLDHYKSVPGDLNHIKQIRKNSSAATCPMCGSLHSGTLDHLLPKEDYPCYAIFGLNLVPACKCNSLRRNDPVGSAPGQRILHPYFDHVLGERLLAAEFTDLGRVPKIRLRILIDATDPSYPAVKFHCENVVMRTSILDYLRIMWGRKLFDPQLLNEKLKHDPASIHDLRTFLEEERDRHDRVRGSKNNWDSVFLSGLLDQPVITWLYERFNQAGRSPGTSLI